MNNKNEWSNKTEWPVCPYCNYVRSDDFYPADEAKECTVFQCEHCGKEFELSAVLVIEYKSRRLKSEQI